MFGMARNWSDHDAKEPASGPRVRSTEAGGKGKVRVVVVDLDLQGVMHGVQF